MEIFGRNKSPESDPRFAEIERIKREVEELDKIGEENRDEEERAQLTFLKDKLYKIELALREEGKM